MNTAFKLSHTVSAPPDARPSAVTIGNFDGVHRGHQAILARLCAHAKAQNLRATVLTFSPHPRAFFAREHRHPEWMPTGISTLRDKVTELRARGVEHVIVQRFDQRLAAMPARTFVHTLLVQRLRVRWLLVGADFRFGHQRGGDVALLRDMAPACGFQLETIDDLCDEQRVRISSSTLRAALQDADLPRARHLLGRPYSLSGHVVHGARLGRTLGYPTLNLRVPENAALRRGVYVVRVHGLGATPLPGAASLGVRPTVTDHGALLLEVHVLDRTLHAYGKLVRVEFLAFLREEETFPDLDTLTAAIREDARQAREYFSSHGL